MANRAKAFAPASIGNLAVGFDVLGLAIAGAGDTVIAERTSEPGVRVIEIHGDHIAHDADQLSGKTDENTASLSAAALWKDAGEHAGLTLKLHKGTPLGSGMGSSAASAVAGVVATNALLAKPRPIDTLIEFAMVGESYASGARHADNVAPSLLGGLVLCPSNLLPDVYPLPGPTQLVSVLVHPHLRVNTAEARRVLGTTVRLRDATTQMGLLSGFVHACHVDDLVLLKRSLADVLVEPQRAPSVKGFSAVKSAAIRSGALGCSLSGSGPSVFALALHEDAQKIAKAMQAEFSALNIDSDVWVSPMDAPGARIIE